MLAGQSLELVLLCSVHSTCAVPCAELTNLGGCGEGISCCNIVVFSDLQGTELGQGILCIGGSIHGDFCADGIGKCSLRSIDIIVSLSCGEGCNGIVQSLDSCLIISNSDGSSGKGCFEICTLFASHISIGFIVQSVLSLGLQFSIARSQIAGSNAFLEGLEFEALPYCPVVTSCLIGLQTNDEVTSLSCGEIYGIHTISFVEPSCSLTTVVNDAVRNLCDNRAPIVHINRTCHTCTLKGNDCEAIGASRQADCLIETGRRYVPILAYAIRLATKVSTFPVCLGLSCWVLDGEGGDIEGLNGVGCCLEGCCASLDGFNGGSFLDCSILCADCLCCDTSDSCILSSCLVCCVWSNQGLGTCHSTSYRSDSRLVTFSSSIGLIVLCHDSIQCSVSSSRNGVFESGCGSYLLCQIVLQCSEIYSVVLQLEVIPKAPTICTRVPGTNRKRTIGHNHSDRSNVIKTS